eukprot:TRINITY_DN3903_c0_g1_i2.p1 TRINITY_DN3903_c0_g1~~TRINITY_DN3903_c0_g1_i2.p1  ORF type:complete len:331 (-),score=67.88 TRINITY_DN3903_c0_g1_i2:90-1082(-)
MLGIKGQDSRNKLLGFLHANIPSVNSLKSAYLCLERPTVFGALKDIQAKLGEEAFPLIKQNFYPSHDTIDDFNGKSTVVKVGHSHAGYGKMKIEDEKTYDSFRELASVHEDYVTTEPFIKWDFDMRIQKIGPHYRGFRRISSNWKGNVGNESFIEDMEVTPAYKRMVDECSNLFGGLDILGLDLLHSQAEDKDYILELNDTAIGLVHKHATEDMEHMKDIVILRMSKLFCDQQNKSCIEDKLKQKLTPKKMKEMLDELQDLKKKRAVLAEKLKQANEQYEEIVEDDGDGDSLPKYVFYGTSAILLLVGMAFIASVWGGIRIFPSSDYKDL